MWWGNTVCCLIWLPTGCSVEYLLVMIRIFVLLCCVAVALTMVAQAQSLDDQYVQIFNLIQEADSQTSPTEALPKYLQAQTALQRLQKANPDWNTKIISFRLIYVANKIAALSAKTPITAPPSKPKEQETAATGTAANRAQPTDWDQQLNGFREQVRQLQAEKVLLEAKLKEALAMQPAESDPRELARSQERVRTLEKENELLRAAADSAKSKPSLTEAQQHTQQLLVERDALQKKLEAANRELSHRKIKAPPEQDQNLRDQLLTAQAKLEVLEARAVPYSAEELARLKVPETKLALAETNQARADSSPVKKSVNQWPPGSADLVAEANSCFAAKQYDKAEAAYSQVLKKEPQSVPALANLAAIQVEASQLDAAERNIQQALALEPDGAFNVYVLGLLRLRQTKYDAALDCFSRCAKLDPKDAHVQNYLCLVLSEKGMRGAAETALRKAVQLQPGYGGAHYNLAIVYLNQEPPALELARWHYQKAIAAGEPRHPELEKKLAANP